jgi:hypothetical protein
MSPSFRRPIGRSASVRFFDVVVRACVATFDASAEFANWLGKSEFGPLALATTAPPSSRVEFVSAADSRVIARAA